MRNTYLIVGIIVVALVIVAFAAVRSRLPRIGQFGGPTPTPTAEETTGTQILISKHTPASTAVVDSANLTEAGFVTIHDEQDAAAGGILGVSELLQSGKHENLVISLTRKTEDGERLFARIYKDSGDGKFDPATDEVVKNQTGNALETQFDVASVTSATNGFQIPATGLGEDDR